MEITNEFHVSVPIDEAWKVLTDLERIAPCMPGAQLTKVDGDDYHGIVKVKVGPISVQYSGIAKMIEADVDAYKAVLRAEGRETRGQGNAAATVTATLTEDAGGTSVAIVTDLAITGKVAEFGRGLMVDISGKLLDQFVRQLEADVLSGVNAGAELSDDETVASPSLLETTDEDEQNETSTTAREVHSTPVEPANLLGVAGRPVAKRLGPLLAIGVIAIVIWKLLSSRRA